MNIVFSLMAHTANILGIFTDPFEFEGDYGSEINSIRDKVFELVVSEQARVQNLSDYEIRELCDLADPSPEEIAQARLSLISQATAKEKAYGPTLKELVTPELIAEIKKTQDALGFTDADFDKILDFLNKYQDKRVFHFLRNNPADLIRLDKNLRDHAARTGKPFALPILSSTQTLEGRCSDELKRHLIEELFTPLTFSLTIPQDWIQKRFSGLETVYLKEIFGAEAQNSDLEVFSSPIGQVFFYWMYQALNLHLIGEDRDLITGVNKVKEIFVRTLGDPESKAQALKEKLIASQTGVFFTQESDATVIETLISDGLFLPVDRQKSHDGTFVLLRSDQWEPDYEVVPVPDYEGFERGRLNIVIARHKESGQQFMLASCHGHSTQAADGREQIGIVKRVFDERSDGTLQLLIGTDANTKSEKDVALLQNKLEELGLVSTRVGPTTIKKRMVTVQHAKACRPAVDEEDYLITLDPQRGGKWIMNDAKVGFPQDHIDVSQSLPNIQNPSDHYPVGAILEKSFITPSL